MNMASFSQQNHQNQHALRQVKESSEQHLVIKTHLQNSMNPVQKAPKTEPQETHITKPHNQTSPPAINGYT